MTGKEIQAEITTLLAEEGDMYQKYADKHGITRKAAKVRLYILLYGGRCK